MLNWIFLQHISRRCNQDFETSKNTKIYISQNPKNTKYRVHTKQRNGRTKNKHCNLLIYTVPLNRVPIEHRCYNIQTIKYHNNAELMFLQCIFRRRQRRLFIFEKHKNLHFSKSKKHKTQGTYKTTERGDQKYTTQSVDLHSPIQQSAD